MSPSLYFSFPSDTLFQFPPSSDPTTLPPPPAGSSTFAPPFTIPASIYNSAYDARVPLTIASVYAVTVVSLNKVNAARGNKPWAISKTAAFRWLVVLHNVFLAVYSAWTFVGMYKGLSRTIPSVYGSDGVIGVIDSLCKLHGSAGPENSLAYSTATSSWQALPGLEAGRMWNEGLAFYGYFFYLSKFYEVVDTAIILAKGKRSSTLQTYHHAGAMLCMWAGMRFMTPAIWMFCFFNSGVHALMYTYYTITSFSVRVPKAIKQTLTTLQISQFIIGVYYAAAHSFLSYDVPVSSSAPPPSAPISPNRRVLFTGPAGAPDQKYETVSCINTSGQTFAVWLNVFYLGPLMYLFMRFFYRSYIRRAAPRVAGGKVAAAAGAVVDAGKGVKRM
ncbi:hypothetical protein VE03_03319 [Pseudogymnoascus sp. 23342-1-I1]|nr:hypothetical protein VE03_03319 [Pseudogymnoascus sp. 23342-1-I1]